MSSSYSISGGSLRKIRSGGKGRSTMRKITSVRTALFVLMVTAVTMIPFGNACGQGTPLYIGEYCWEGDDDSFTRIGITLMGEGHFLFSGTVTDPGSGNNFPVHGNIEIDGTNVIMAAVASLTQNGTVVSSVGNIVLDISTLDGTSDMIHQRYEGGLIILGHEAHDLYSVSCDGSAAADGIDKREELKKLLKKYSTLSDEIQE
jgi:hypothetical protein